MKYTHAKIIDKGGIGCSCCRRVGSKKACRVALNRRERRAAKLTIANE